MELIAKNNKNKIIFLAKRFAIKEAVVKAIGCGIGSYISFHDIIVVKNKLGAPMIKKNLIITSVVRKLHHVPSCEIYISVSDEKKHAIAIANLTTGKEHHAVDIN
jgi:holo-[acyl-carrier protein] synthase